MDLRISIKKPVNLNDHRSCQETRCAHNVTKVTVVIQLTNCHSKLYKMSHEMKSKHFL